MSSNTRNSGSNRNNNRNNNYKKNNYNKNNYNNNRAKNSNSYKHDNKKLVAKNDSLFKRILKSISFKGFFGLEDLNSKSKNNKKYTKKAASGVIFPVNRKNSKNNKNGNYSSRQNNSLEDRNNSYGSTEIHRRRKRLRDGKRGDSKVLSGSKSDYKKNYSSSTRLDNKGNRKNDNYRNKKSRILTEVDYVKRANPLSRTMLVRDNNEIVKGSGPIPGGINKGERYTQIAVLEDKKLAEHFITTSTSASMVGNVYLGKVQNVLPSMEAAFVDIGEGRNGVLYAGEIDWDKAELSGDDRKIEEVLKPGDLIVVQVSKDPISSKGARLTTQVSLAGRHIVFMPDNEVTGISRKLPEAERTRLKDILDNIQPNNVGIIVRTASAGVSAEELSNDLNRLQSEWTAISKQIELEKTKASGKPILLYEEPDLLIKVVRDLFNEDFSEMYVAGEESWKKIQAYLTNIAPDLLDRVKKYDKSLNAGLDIYDRYKVDEQLSGALARKVWLPSGGTLVIDRTEAMTVIDVNTGKFIGTGGNLEETVTRNNLEAADEIVRQIRLRDIGGIIIVDFIDMQDEVNREQVLTRLIEKLGDDRTRHQVSEVTSLGLIQITRKKLGTGLVEAFSIPCPTCAGRGILIPGEVILTDQKTIEAAEGMRRSEKHKDLEHKDVEHMDTNPSAHPMIAAMGKSDHTEDKNEVNGSNGKNSSAAQRISKSRRRRTRGQSDDSIAELDAIIENIKADDKAASNSEIASSKVNDNAKLVDKTKTVDKTKSRARKPKEVKEDKIAKPAQAKSSDELNKDKPRKVTLSAGYNMNEKELPDDLKKQRDKAKDVDYKVTDVKISSSPVVTENKVETTVRRKAVWNKESDIK